MRRVIQENRLTSSPNVAQFLFSRGLSWDHYSLHINNMNKISRLEPKLTRSKERAYVLVTKGRAYVLVTLQFHSTKASVYLLSIAVSRTLSKCLK